MFQVEDSNEIYMPGSRIGVMLTHGVTGCPSEMSYIAKQLNRYGFTVYCPKLVGHCSTKAELVKYDRYDWLFGIKAAYRKLAKEVDVVFAVGQSVGGLLNLELGIYNPHFFRSIATYSAAFNWDGWNSPKFGKYIPQILEMPIIGNMINIKEKYPYGIKNNRLREKVVNRIRENKVNELNYVGFPAHASRELFRIGRSVKAQLPYVQCPLLIVHSKDDDMASINNSLLIQQNVNVPTKLLIVENSYHMISLDNDKDLVAEATAKYFFENLDESEKDELMHNSEIFIYQDDSVWNMYMNGATLM